MPGNANGNNLTAKVTVREALIRAPKPATKNGSVAFAESFVKYFSVVFVVVILFSIIGLGYLLYSLTSGDLDQLKTLIAQNQNELSLKQQKIEELKKIKTGYEGLNDSAKKIIDALPQKADLPGIFIQLEQLAVKNNLLLNSLDIANKDSAEKDKKEIEGLNKLSIILSISGGDYFAFKKFLFDMENNLRLLDVKSLAYSPEENSYNIVLNTYYLAE